MAQSFPPHIGMGPGGGHPGLPHGHPMAGMQHPGAGHMGGPNPGMMQGMHPGVSGPQVTQGQMIAGMPQGPVTSGPGAHAMAHLGPQPPNPMFQQQNQQQMTFAQLPPHQQQAMRHRHLFNQIQQHQQQQNMAGMMQPQGNQNMGMSQQHFSQMKAGMNMPNVQQQMQMQAQANAQAQNMQNHAHQQQLMAQHQQRQMLQAQQQQQQQRSVSQQMTMSRSQEQASQPPQSIPTPAPQNPAQMQQQPAPPIPPPGAQPKQQPQPPNPQQQPQQNQVGTPQQVNDAVQVKQQDMGANLNTLEDVSMNEGLGNGLTGQGILRLLMFQDQLCPLPERVCELEYWEDFVRIHFSPFGVLRQQLHNQKTGESKAFQIQFVSLARFYHAHFTSGVKEMRMEPSNCTETKLPHGGCNVYSPKTSITYLYDNDIRVITDGWIQCNFDATNRIEHLSINTRGWTEYIPRGLWPSPDSPDQKQSPKMSKNAKKPQKPQPVLSVAPPSGISDNGVPKNIVQFLEVSCNLCNRGIPTNLFLDRRDHDGHGSFDGILAKESRTQTARGNASYGRGNSAEHAHESHCSQRKWRHADEPWSTNTWFEWTQSIQFASHEPSGAPPTRITPY
jgi:hypothetical protein